MTKGRIAVGAAAAAVTSIAATVGYLLPTTEPDSQQLSAYQQRCAVALSAFVSSIPLIEGGRYSVTFGEAHRPEWVAKIYAASGKGIANSLHTQRLAIDLNLFVDGKFREDGEAHKPLADLWLATGSKFGIEPASGYYFNDANHYSCQYGGRK